jgi:hypothetical protein
MHVLVIVSDTLDISKDYAAIQEVIATFFWVSFRFNLRVS